MSAVSWREPLAVSWHEPPAVSWREPLAHSFTDEAAWPTSDYLLVTEDGAYLVDELGNQLAYA